MIRSIYRSMHLFVLCCLLAPLVTWAAPPHSNAPLQLTPDLIGTPVARGTLFSWIERAANRFKLIGYDRANGTRTTLATLDQPPAALASDGTSIIWAETNTTNTTINAFEQTGRRVLFSVAGGVNGLALADQTVYYARTGTERGLVAHNLIDGFERMISAHGQRPIAADGALLWSESGDERTPATWSLHLIEPARAGAVVELARGNGPISYAASADQIVWSFAPPAVDRRVFAYDRSTGTVRAVSSDPAQMPVAANDLIAWTSEPRSDPPRWSIEASDPARQTRTTLITDHATRLITYALAGNALLVGSDDRAGRTALYLIDAPQAGPTLPAPPDDPIRPLHVCETALECGQVYKSGPWLYDARGRWQINGVQFFLPDYGINTWTFYDRNYARSSEQIDLWLDRAREYVQAQTLRIFVELPTGDSTPTSYATILDFAQRANTRGMRLGVVLHNSRDFRMLPERQAWLLGFVLYMQAAGAEPLIAYVSAGNEINNWCGRDDCFDNNPAYVDAAVNWVAQFNHLFKSRNSAILTTVGISTEVRDLDSVPAALDFGKPSSSGARLADLVDFIAPHNYAGGAYGVYDTLRTQLGYAGPIALEEFGWSTDPAPDDARFTEGLPVCRDDPLSAACANTAPYFVEFNLKALREVGYAGGAAWMLADIATKRCGSDPGDLWTGLFATGTGYCGGTQTPPEQPKATATRIRLHFGGTQRDVVYFPWIGR